MGMDTIYRSPRFQIEIDIRPGMKHALVVDRERKRKINFYQKGCADFLDELSAAYDAASETDEMSPTVLDAVCMKYEDMMEP